MQPSQHLQIVQKRESSFNATEPGSNTGPLKRPLQNNSSIDIIEMIEETNTDDFKVILFIIVCFFVFYI